MTTMTKIADEGKAEYKTAHDDAPFFLPCGHYAGSIHRDENGVPYLAVANANAVYHIYGHAPIYCHCKAEGEWLPDRAGMLAVIDAWRRRREKVKKAKIELEKIR